MIIELNSFHWSKAINYLIQPQKGLKHTLHKHWYILFCTIMNRSNDWSNDVKNMSDALLWLKNINTFTTVKHQYVFINLLKNILKTCFPGGSIYIVASIIGLNHQPNKSVLSDSKAFTSKHRVCKISVVTKLFQH